MDGLIFHSHYLNNRVRTKLDFKCLSKVIYHIGYFEEPGGSKDGGEFKIYVPGFLTPTKSIYFLLDYLNQINYDFKLIINSSPLRGGEDMKVLRSKIKSLGMENKIVTTGFLDDVEFVNMFRRADIILIPRRDTLGETSGGMIHGLCMGKPVIGPNIGGYPEYLSGHGLLSRPNPASWIENIEKLLGNREMREHLGSKAKEFARKNLSSERIAREHEEFYLDILNKPSPIAVPPYTPF